MRLREKGIIKLNSAGVSVDLNAVATTNLYTCPSGKIMLPTYVVIRDLSGDTALAVVTFGQTGDKDDWCPAIALGEQLDAASESLIIKPFNDLWGSDTWDAGSIADGDEEAKDVTVTGVALGDFARASLSIDLTDLVLDAHVTAADTVTCVLANNTGGAIDLASATVRVKVERFNKAFPQYTAGEIFCVDVTTAAGGTCTCVMDVFGYEWDAA